MIPGISDLVNIRWISKFLFIVKFLDDNDALGLGLQFENYGLRLVLLRFKCALNHQSWC